MPVLDDVAEGVLKLLFHFIFEIVFFYTGECVLYVVTFGLKKPRWDYYSNESLPKWAIFTEISWWIGFFFWIFVIGLIARQLLK